MLLLRVMKKVGLVVTKSILARATLVTDLTIPWFADVIKMCLGIKVGLVCLLRPFLLYKGYPSLKFLPFSSKNQMYKFQGWEYPMVSQDDSEALQLGSQPDDTEKLPLALQTLHWSSSKALVTP